MAGRLADPAPEGVIERADFGVAERKGDFRQRQSVVFQEVQRQRLAHVVLQVGVVHAGILQPPLQRPHRGAGRLGEVPDAALALDQHAGDLAAQLLDLAALFRQSGEPKIAVMAHEALDNGIGRRHRPLEQAGVKADTGPGMAGPDVVAHDLRAGAAGRPVADEHQFRRTGFPSDANGRAQAPAAKASILRCRYLRNQTRRRNFDVASGAARSRLQSSR